MSNILDEIKKRMEGKTVLRVEAPQADEAICLFHMSDGTVFRLHATDLGAWIEDTVTPGASYATLNLLFRDYAHHASRLNDYGPPRSTSVTDLPEMPFNFEVLVTAPDGRDFKALILKESADGHLLLLSNVAERISEAAEMGDFWRQAFK